MKGKEETISFRVDAEIKERIEELRKLSNRSISDITRDYFLTGLELSEISNKLKQFEDKIDTLKQFIEGQTQSSLQIPCEQKFKEMKNLLYTAIGISSFALILLFLK